jgi:hypothetical protein
MLRSLVIGPQSIRARIIRTSLISAVGLTIWTPFLGLGTLIHDGPPIVGWIEGVLLWIVAVIAIPVYYWSANRVKRAMTAYVIMMLSLIPLSLSFIDAGIRLSYRHLGTISASWILIGLIVGIAVTPLAVSSRRQWFRDAVDHGHLKPSLNPKSQTWDPKHDFVQTELRLASQRPGCLLRLLPWIGPAIGMTFADVFGRSTANTVLIFCLVAPGYAIFQMSLVATLMFYFEFNRLERELGGQILLVDED